MSIFRIHHITKFIYDRPVRESVNQMRIYPLMDDGQDILSHEVIISRQVVPYVYTDYWGNRTGFFNLAAQHQELIVESKLLARAKVNASALPWNISWEEVSELAQKEWMLLEFSRQEEIKSQDAVNSIIDELKLKKYDIVTAAKTCCEYVNKSFTYKKGITNIYTTVDEILEHKSGVCQDFAHLMLQIMRTAGVPGRYVSGYICPHRSGLAGEGATHAWVEIFIPGYGWLGLDPTNNMLVTDTHIRLATGRNFVDCSPVIGSFKGPAKQQLFVQVKVGYEDGFEFTDNTEVELEKQEPAVADSILTDSFAGQQQQ